MSMICVISPAKEALAESRGIRNNNPGNIIKSDNPWKGKIKCPDTKFECFDTLENGLRALFLLLNNYYILYNLKTPREIISRYAPPKENNTESYIKFIENRVCKCDIFKNNKINDLIIGIIIYENGHTNTALIIKKIQKTNLQYLVQKD